MHGYPIHDTYWHAVVIAFVLTAAASDLRWRRIPRWLTVGALLCGIGYHAYFGGILPSLIAGFVGFGVGLVLFQLGAIGGGDVKLIAALGAMLGFSQWLFAMEISIFAAAAIALAQAIAHKRLRQTIGSVLELFSWLTQGKARKHPSIHVGNPSRLRAPFGAAAALGTVVALFR